jgi:hypothetical protein
MVGLNRRIGISVGRGRAAGAGPTPGPELWPQPTFGASTGLTLIRSSIAANKWTTNNSGATASCLMASPPAIANGDQFQYAVIVNTASAGTVALQIGGVDQVDLVAGSNTGTLTVAARSTDAIRLFSTNDGAVADVISACSVKKLT